MSACDITVLCPVIAIIVFMCPIVQVEATYVVPMLYVMYRYNKMAGKQEPFLDT